MKCEVCSRAVGVGDGLQGGGGGKECGGYMFTGLVQERVE